VGKNGIASVEDPGRFFAVLRDSIAALEDGGPRTP
jgi:hypothetical protein